MKIIVILIFSLISSSLTAQQLFLQVHGIRSSKGVLRIGVFQNQKQFDQEKPYRSFVFAKGDVVAGFLLAKIPVVQGNYAITVLDDEDNSGNMTYKFKIFPTEGVGFSNYRLNKPLKPKFSDFDFIFDKNNADILIKLQYF
jgi:uncharacterized protein (DUF2141 family)